MFAKKQVFAMLLAWCAMSIAASADTVVLVKRDNAGVYQNRIRKIFETPLFTVLTQDRLLVKETKGDRYLVRYREGREGWIEKSACVRAPRSATFTYDPVELTAFHNGLNPIHIGAPSDQPDEMILLDSSFKEELRLNTDKESIERQVAR
jgi:hypothetical protein